MHLTSRFRKCHLGGNTMRRLLAFAPLVVLSSAFADICVTNKRTQAVIAIPSPSAHLVYGAQPKQHVELWLPAGAAPAEGRPVAVYIHGGSWTSGEAVDIVLAEHLKELLDRGIAVASISYRLLQDAKGVNPPVKAVKDDVTAALLKLKASAAAYGVDGDRLGLAGGSAGACMALAVALSDGNFLGVSFVAAAYPQTTLDPQEMKAWIPNQGTYGAHAFGMKWNDFLAKREGLLPEIERYSPAALARKIDPTIAPEIVMEYWPGSFPASEGKTVKGPVHSAQFGAAFERICKERGIPCTLLKGPCKEVWKRLADALAGTADEKEFKPGSKKIYTFDSPSLAPILYGAESRAEGAEATEYCVYLDLEHADGSWTYVERTFFRSGTHGWHRARGVFVPRKPVKRVNFNMLLRGNAKGKAVFRRPFLVRATGPGEFGVSVRSDRPFSDFDIREGWRFDGKSTKPFCERVPAALPVCNPLHDGELAVWTAPATRVVTPLDFPTDAERALQTVALDLAQGERESFQVNLSAGAGAGCDGVTLEIGPFLAAGGRRFDGRVTWERVGYLKRENGAAQHPDAPPPTVRWLPDPLLPAAPMKVRAGGTQGAWVTAHALRRAQPGRYSGVVRVKAGAETLATVPVALTVRPFALPEHFGMATAFAVMDGFTRAAYPDRFAEMKRRTWDLMLDHRLNPDDISRTEPPAVDDLVYARKRGMSLFNILNIVPKPTRPVKWVCYAPPAATDSEAFYETFAARVRPYREELKRHGLAGLGYIYGFDERAAEYYPGVRRFWERWRRDFPDIPVMTTAMMYRDMARAGGDTNLADRLITDWHCPLTPEYREDFSAALRRDHGMKTWWYVCCSPRHPYANIASLEYPAREGRMLGWQTWAFRADGLLYWHVNLWPDRIKLDEADTYFPGWPTANSLHMPGDGILLYPGKETVLPSIRLAAVRDGVEDYERLEAIAARLGRETVRKAALEVSPSVTEFDRTGERLLGIRTALADRFEKAR